jgi:hypothetical protein
MPDVGYQGTFTHFTVGSSDCDMIVVSGDSLQALKPDPIYKLGESKPA